ncbi:MAG: hypothetical protein ABJA67_05755, partial [Chthonomonadales bacterium]
RQYVRLQQISIRQWGPRVLDCPGVAEMKGISPKAMTAIDGAQDSVQKAMAVRIRIFVKQNHVPMINTKGGKLPSDTPGIIRMKKQCDRALWDVVRRSLTKHQMSELIKLLGPPYNGK